MLCAYVFAVVLVLVGAELPVTHPVQWKDAPLKQHPSHALASPYLGKCICDATWGLCDPNCCCDADCSSVQRIKFIFCLEDNWSPSTTVNCQGDWAPTKAISTDGRYLDRTGFGHHALCTVRPSSVRDTNAFFANPEKVRNPLEKFPRGRVDSSKLEMCAADSALSILKTTEPHDVPSEFRRAGFLSIPSSRWDGYCGTNSKQARFMKPIDSTTCLSSGRDICTSYPVSSFTNLFVSSGRDMNLISIPISVQLIDDISGEVLADTSSENVAALRFESVVRDGICENAVVRVHHAVSYEHDGSHLFVVNATSQLHVRRVSTDAIVSLLFRIVFFEGPIRAPFNYFSGNAGYSSGSRVRAGALVKYSGEVRIAERVSGFSVLGSGGPCFDPRHRRVGFLHNLVDSGCIVSMSEDALREVCKLNGTGTLLRGFLGVNSHVLRDFGEAKPIDHIAKTADARTNDISGWLPLEGMNFKDVTPEPYDFVERECRNVYVGLQYNFVVSRVGTADSLQDVIVGAFAEPIVGKWKIRNATDFTGGATSDQRFRFTVTFTRLDRKFSQMIK